LELAQKVIDDEEKMDGSIPMKVDQALHPVALVVVNDDGGGGYDDDNDSRNV